MKVDLPSNQMEELNALSAQTGKGVAVSKMFAYNDWFKAQVRISVAQIQRGEFIGRG